MSADEILLGRGRLVSVDVLRGLVMILMAVDHARYYFSGAHVSPEDMAATDLPLFATRWVTHLCAPAFFFLTGLSIHLSGERRRGPLSPRALAALRGLWLIVLELTVIGFAWTFNPGYSVAGVIWCLGWAMIFVAALSAAPAWLAAVVGATMVAGHNLLDGIDPRSFGDWAWVWQLLHVPWNANLPGGVTWFVLFPLIPWIGVAALGYASGPLFALDPVRRRRVLTGSGLAMLVAFVALRVGNGYGNPATPSIDGAAGTFAWPSGTDWDHALIALLNVEKYPPSLQFVLMTLGVCALALAGLQRYDHGRTPGPVARIVRTFGLVPMAFYVLHILLLHTLAWTVAVAAGQPSQWLAWGGRFPVGSPPEYGYSLIGVYLATATVLVLLYLPCRWFAQYKARSRSWWLALI